MLTVGPVAAPDAAAETGGADAEETAADDGAVAGADDGAMAEDEELAVEDAAVAGVEEAVVAVFELLLQPATATSEVVARTVSHCTECLRMFPLIRTGLCGCGAHSQPPLALQ